MHKEKITLGNRVKRFFIYHPWLKLIAFILAVLVWFYVKGEISTTN